MPKVYNQSPYNDDFNPNSGYTKLLAVPGRSEQAREFTQIQSIFMEYMKRLGDTILKDGSIVEGCDIAISDKRVTITSGKVYLGGLVRNVDGGIVNILGVGNETIGVALDESIVTEIDDPSFRDPAQGFENYGQAGAHRVKETVRFVVNDSTSAVIYRLYNGELINETVKPEIDIITDVLARRTFDESGNYKVSGLELRTRNESDGEKIYLSLSEGKAYVKGYEIVKPSATKVPIEYSRETRQILNEPKTYLNNTTEYKLNNFPASQLTQVKCVVEVTETLTRGNIAGGLDYLGKTPVVDIVSVVQNGITFVKGKDYQLTNDAVDWSLTGNDPSPGTQYTVTWQYHKIMSVGTDIELITDNENNVSKLKFLDGGAKPVNNTSFDIDYTFFLARKDLVCIDSVGKIEVLQGKSDIVRLLETPLNKDNSLLSVASILIYPNSTKVDIMNFSVTAMSMEDLYKLVRRVEDSEYNQAIADLDQEAIDGESATNLKGIFTDGFVGFTKCDVNHSEFDIALDLDTCEITLPSTQDIDSMIPGGGSDIGDFGTVITAPYREVVGVNQPNATDVMLVNPYAVYDKMLLIQLTPAVDNWVESETVVVNQQVVKTEYFRRWWHHLGDSWADAEKRNWEKVFGKNNYTDDWGNNGENSITTVEITQKKVLDEAIMYMRQTQVKVEGFGFMPMQDNIECYFDGTKVPISAISPSTSGTQDNTVRADASGKVTGRITVPPNVPCGSVTVELKCLQGSGSTVYKAQGRHQIIQESVLTTTIIANLTDPLAQSFVFTDKDTLLTSVDLFFASKDDNAPLNIQIRNMVNGYPGSICYAETVVQPQHVNVSPDSSRETKVTFNQPVLCQKGEQYCIAVLSDSNLYSMYIATLGGTDILTKELVNRQPYSVGVLFSSSNNSTWTAHQTQDLKFRVNVAEYTGEKGSIVFNSVSNKTINRLLLISDTLNPNNTGVSWFYSINDGNWLPIETYVDRETSSIATKISLKAEIDVKNGVSAIVAKNTINLVSFMTKSKGAYVSKNVVLGENFGNIRVSCEFSLPSGTSAKVYYSTDGNGNTWTELTSPQLTKVDEEFYRYEYSKAVTGKNYRVKVALETSNPLVRPRGRKLISILKY